MMSGVSAQCRECGYDFTSDQAAAVRTDALRRCPVCDSTNVSLHVRAFAEVATAAGNAYPPEAVMRMALVVDHVGTWADAVAIEAALALESANNLQMNMARVKVHGFMLGLALRNLLRSVDWAIAGADAAKDGDRSKALRAALETFNGEVPDVVRFRDVVNYLDDYLRGSGRHKDVRVVNPYLERSSLDVVRLHVADGLELDVGRAAQAAAVLATAVVDIFQR
jgi:hypothetical protein